MKKTLYLLLVIFLFYACKINKPGMSNIGIFDFNKNWEFVKDIDTTILPGMFQTNYPEIKWGKITLPHSPVIEPLVIKDQQWQGTCFYRKFFNKPVNSENRYIALRFGAAMHEAEIFLNGSGILTHKGGYLPSVKMI